MKKLLIGSVAALVLSGCSLQPSIPDERVGDLVFIYNQPNSLIAKQSADVMCGGKSYRIYNIGHGYSGKPGTLRIPFACTQKSALEYGSLDAKEEIRSDDVKEQMRRVTAIPLDGEKAKSFFMQETHLFMLSECGWAGTVGFSTGPKPLVLLGDSYYPGKPSFNDGEYSITFNGGSMRVSYIPKKVKGFISDSRSFTPCSAVRLGEE